MAGDRDARRKAQAERDKFLLQMTKRTVVAQERQAKLAEKQSRSKTLELLGFKMAAAAALMGGRAGK